MQLTKTLITLSLLFLFISVGVYNLQIQVMDSHYKLVKTVDIVQCLELPELITEYIYER